jgi:predicted aspartyl protease
LKNRPRRALLLAAALAGAAACAVSFNKMVMVHDVEGARRPPGLNFNNYEQALEDGYFPEVETFLSRQSAEYQARPTIQAALARCALYRNDLDRARTLGEEALRSLPRTIPRYGKLAWTLAMAAYFQDDFARASDHAATAQDWGNQTDAGFRTFLRTAPARLYEFDGPRMATAFDYGSPRIPRFPVTLPNGRTAEVIVDTGASLTFVSESVARELGVPLTDAMKSWGYGLHGKLIPIHLAHLEALTVGGLTVRNIPAMVFADRDLQFGAFRVEVGLGYHLLRHGRLSVNYHRKSLEWTVAPSAAPEPGANLCILGLRPGVRVSLNQVMGYHFILDTGSEMTYVTSQGSRRAILQEKINFFHMITHGIGKSKANYTSISNVYVGTGAFMVKYANIPTKSEYAALVDGILGNDFMDNFLTDIDFPAGVLTVREAK